MSTTSEYPELLAIDAGGEVRVVTFAANSEYLIGGGHGAVQVWRVKDGKQVVMIPLAVEYTQCVAASKDGRWIAMGSSSQVLVWNTTTYEQVYSDWSGYSNISDVDFSPDSTRLIFTTGNTATIVDIATRQKVQTFHHGSVFSAKYSPHGERVATAGYSSVLVWDSNDGRLLVDIQVGVALLHTLLWRDNHLFVQTNDGRIKKIDASARSTISEWPVPSATSCIALPQHEEFIAFAAEKTITFLDTSANSEPSHIQHSDNIRSMSLSCDDRLLVIAAGSKVTVKVLSSVASTTVSVAKRNDLSSVLFRTISEPELDIDTAALDAWKHDQLTDAETLLSAAIPTSENTTHHVLASRALVRARLGQWEAALVDAEESIRIERSLLAYVAKCVALIGKGEKDEGICVCDTAFEHFHLEHVSLLLLIKAIVLFMAGDYADAISRMNHLITDSAHARADTALYAVQAYMHLFLGNMHVEGSDHERAIRSFEDARNKLANHICQPPLVVTLISGWCFDDLVITINQRLCEAFLAADRTKEAVESVLRMLDEDIDMTESTKTWVSDFKCRCRGKSENLGDSAMSAKQYDEAISQYTAALSLDPATPQVLANRSRVYVAKGKWEDALDDANKVIELDPSSPLGYERKYAALLGLKRRDDATDAFETMLLKMSGSSDPEVRERSNHYVRPEQAEKEIRTSVQNAIRDSPLVLINTLSGRLCNKSEQAAAFESNPAFTTLILSMTTYVDHALVEQVVEGFYRYATFSHTWESNEPLYETVVKTVVYDLESFPTHSKLQMFCKIVRDEGFNWAWSDTCCINKGDQFVLQEALVSMFKWYGGSAMTIIFLCDVDRLAEIGALIMSLWNSRGWTLQEYHASKVVRIYTKDWTPYLGLTIYNHKESPEIISEMEKATGISAESLMALRPGLNDIREKLRLASTRQTTRVEDAAYSLLGIFSMTLPVTYGEGDKALGRLLSQLLSSSGDTSILAWTGRSSSFNSCLPTNIAVFSHPLTLHIPPAISDAEMARITAGLRALSLDLDLVRRLYDQLNDLPLPLFVVQRMKLPCLAFKIRIISPFRSGVYRAQAGALGVVEIRTRQNIAGVDSLYLIHPWIDSLLDRRGAGNRIDIAPREDETFFEVNESPSSSSFPALPSTLNQDPRDDASLPSPTVPSVDAEMKFLARLRQPFGALLLAPTRRNVAEFRRIATENVITVQVQEVTSATLSRLIEGIHVLDVL